MPRIQILDDRLISQIAAGEVVERPSSVVKELIENAIDAGAREIGVELESGGKRRVVVTDDGRGMDSDDALLAFDRHATSKIAAFNDLEQVQTLGFRGEALASIAAVSRTELRTAEQPGDGTLVRIEGGRVKRAEPVSHPRGTRVEIASLFFNVPARRKFLKRPQTELRHCLQVAQGYALAHPDLRFTVRHEGRALIDTLPTRDDGAGIRERINQVFGASLARNLEEIPLEFITESEAIAGFVGNRETTRGRRIFVFVNRRLVRDRAVLASFYRAVREEWKADDYPALFLYLDLEPQEVDVNVHPQKAEVRFRSPAFVDRVAQALRATLAAARGEEPAPLTEPRSLPTVPAAWEGLGGRSAEPAGAEPWRPMPAPENERSAPAGLGGPAGPAPPAGEVREGAAAYPSAPSGGRIAQTSWRPPEPRMVPLSGRSGEARPFRILGQYKGTLILLEGPDGLYLIDQHVAHERLLYERLRLSLQGERSTSQTLLTPPLLELGPSEALRLKELAPALEPCGFSLSPMSGNTIALTAIPTMVSLDEAESMLQTLATTSGEADLDAQALRSKLLDALAASMACQAAVKMHHPMSIDKMERLVTELFRAEQPY
ncbi:MAG: DNA mismatch repair endonuclease MutL, partial [bacterium]|nr:DNA mismatch repair endonuclease MutL [bacterium]